MGEVRKLDIALSEEMVGAFDDAIATGEYADDADIVGVALAQWQRRQADHIAYLGGRGPRGSPARADRCDRRLLRKHQATRPRTAGGTARRGMMPVTFPPRAEHDLLEIYVTIGQENEPTARRQVDRIRAAVRQLHDYPHSAPLRPDIAPNTRGMVVGHHVALHRVTTDEVQVVRIMHMAQEPSALTIDFVADD